MNTPSVHPTIPARYPGDLEKGTPVAPTDPERFRQLIILIPADADCASFTRRISRLAIETNSCVHLLGLYRDEEQELALRREMAVTSALIRDARIYVESTIERGTDWVAAVRRIYQEGDTIVCLTEQLTGVRRKPLSQILESSFTTTVSVLSEAPMQKQKSRLLSRAVAWAGLAAIIGGFFILQVDITRLPQDGFQTLLLILLLVPEIWLVQLWNSLFF